MLEYSIGVKNRDYYTLWMRCKSSVTNSGFTKFNGEKIAKKKVFPLVKI